MLQADLGLVGDKMRSRSARIMALSCLVFLIIASPSLSQSNQPSGTITVGFFPDITNADPQVSNELPPLYLFVEGLTSVDPAGKVVPFLAESWTISNGGRTYTFKLRPNVLFHNGRKLTAEDVKFSIERVKNPGTAAFRQADVRLVQSVTVLNPQTVQITLGDVNAAFPAILMGIFIIAPESVGSDGKITKPIGTGPFQFSEWQPGDRLILQRFPQYWQTGLPKVDRVVVRIISDDLVKANGLRSGDLDLVPGVPPELVPLLQRDPAIQVESANTTIYGHLTFNMRNPPGPLKDVRVRRAIAYGLDKSQLVKARGSLSGIINNQMYRPGQFWYVNLLDEFAQPNLARAQALLREAGVGGFSVELIALTRWERIAAVIQQQLRRLGVEVRVTSIPDFATFQARLSKYDYGMLTDTSYPRDDPSQIFGFWQTGSPSNIYRGGFQDPRLDQLLLAASTQPNPVVRKNYYSDALRIVEYENVATVVYSGEGEIWAYRKRLEGFRVTSTMRLHHSGGGLAYTSVSR